MNNQDKRARRKGGGRKPTGKELVPRQFCISAHMWAIIADQAKEKRMSRSAWIRRAINNQYGRETGIW